MVKFTFNKKARVALAAAIKKLETGSFIGAVLGAFGADPRVTAVAALVVFVACRIVETIIAGIEDMQPDSGDSEPRPRKAHRNEGASDDDA